MPDYNEDRIKKFAEVYHSCLLKSVLDNPGEYFNCPKTNENDAQVLYAGYLADRMIRSVRENGLASVNLSDNFCKAARKLKLKPTYKAINAYLEGKDE